MPRDRSQDRRLYRRIFTRKLEAFPVDVWVRRALAEWYFPMQKKPPDKAMVEWAQGYFGKYAGYSQQYLFHGRRMQK